MVSASSSLTGIPVLPDEPRQPQDDPSGAPSTILEDKEAGLTASLEDDWQDDPDNPRRWPSGKKWTSSVILSLYAFVSPLSSSITAPGLPEIAAKYNFTNDTVLAMTLSIFLISFGIARRNTLAPAFVSGTVVGIFGFGMMSTFLPIQLYLVDAFTYAASASSAAAVFRCLFGFVFPLFGQQMFGETGAATPYLEASQSCWGFPSPSIFITTARRFGRRATVLEPGTG
ncbi:hypothetical protein DFH06DRAFT_1479413 [Mycena polygramma]|nr:hypothetical protein DFH06DRAFT_1479413 [Mycena polygramma]